MKRVAIALIALLLGLGALPVIGAAGRISEQPTCRDVNRARAEEPSGGGCFEGSTIRRAGVAGLLYCAAGAAILAMVIGAAAALRNSRGTLFALAALLPVALFFGAYGVARL